VVKVLGAGSYGTVMLAVDNFGNQYAIKEIKDSGNLFGVDGFSLREIALLKEIDHENVVKLFCLEYIVKGKFFKFFLVLLRTEDLILFLLTKQRRNFS
jgi:serine/threonine protein kinase